MMDILLLRLDAPLMSFGAVAVDEVRRTEDLPTLSMLTGLLGNALGYDHRDHDALQALQSALRYAVRGPIGCERLVDYQTVDLGQDFMLADTVGWTTRGRVDIRKGGTAKTGTHIRKRHYLVDAVYTVALTTEGIVDVEALERALRRPARPLFIGRKSCLPAAPLLLARVQAESLYHALTVRPGGWDAISKGAPFVDDRECSGFVAGGKARVRVWTAVSGPSDSDGASAARDGSGRHGLVPMIDQRDWKNQAHLGRRWMQWQVVEVSA